jgi:hypothetical protein
MGDISVPGGQLFALPTQQLLIKPSIAHYRQ